VRAGVDEHSHRVSRGVCVVKLKAISLLVGAVIASSFSAPTKYGTGNRADAADAEPSVAKGTVTIPEFVPVVNFSEFVLATQQFASEKGLSGREAAEALSAKFASASDGQRVELHEAQQLPTPAIVTSALSIPVPDPSGRPEEYLADPVKVASVVQEEPQVVPQPRRMQKKKTASASQPPVQRPYQPAMGLGMTLEPAEDMPPPSSLVRRKKKTADRSVNGRVASAEKPEIAGAGNIPKAANNDGVVNDAYQIGIPGQSLEPLISTCAKVQRDCKGKLFCGC
jgi:hypothetical protein